MSSDIFCRKSPGITLAICFLVFLQLHKSSSTLTKKSMILLSQLQDRYSDLFRENTQYDQEINATLLEAFVKHAGVIGYDFRKKDTSGVLHHIYFNTYLSIPSGKRVISRPLEAVPRILFSERFLLTNDTRFKVLSFSHNWRIRQQHIVLNLRDLTVIADFERAADLRNYNVVKMANIKGSVRIRFQNVTYRIFTMLEPVADTTLRVRDVVSWLDVTGVQVKVNSSTQDSFHYDKSAVRDYTALLTLIREALDAWIKLYMNDLLEQHVVLSQLLKTPISKPTDLAREIDLHNNEILDTFTQRLKQSLNISRIKLKPFTFEDPDGTIIELNKGYVSGIESVARVVGTSAFKPPESPANEVFTTRFGASKLMVVYNYQAILPNSEPVAGAVMLDLSALRLRIVWQLNWEMYNGFLEMAEVITSGKYLTVTGPIARSMTPIRQMVVNQISSLIEQTLQKELEYHEANKLVRPKKKSKNSAEPAYIETVGLRLNDYPIIPPNSTNIKDLLKKFISQVDSVMRERTISRKKDEYISDVFDSLKKLKDSATLIDKFGENQLKTKLGLISLVSRIARMSDDIEGLNELIKNTDPVRSRKHHQLQSAGKIEKEIIHEILVKITGSMQDAGVLLKAFQIIKYANTILCILWSSGVNKKWIRQSNLVHQHTNIVKEVANEIIELMLAEAPLQEMLQRVDQILDATVDIQTEKYFLRPYDDIKCIADHIEKRTKSLKHFLKAPKCKNKNEFQCNLKKDSQCISFDKYCDNKADCSNRLDETWCDYGECQQFDFLKCPSSGKCIDVSPGCKCEKECREKWSTSSTTQRQLPSTTSDVDKDATETTKPNEENDWPNTNDETDSSGNDATDTTKPNKDNDWPNTNDETDSSGNDATETTKPNEENDWPNTDDETDSSGNDATETTKPNEDNDWPNTNDETDSSGNETDATITTKPNKEKCFGYWCKPDGPCVPASSVCDGKVDCPNADDESGCSETPTENGTIICKKIYCRPDCKDGDEFKIKECSCWIQKCCVKDNLGNLTCWDGTCFREDKICNGGNRRFDRNSSCKNTAVLMQCDSGVCDITWDLKTLRHSVQKFGMKLQLSLKKLTPTHSRRSKARLVEQIWKPVLDRSHSLHRLTLTRRSGRIKLKETARRIASKVQGAVHKLLASGIPVVADSSRSLRTMKLALHNIQRCST